MAARKNSNYENCYPNSDFTSRRSPVICLNGAVASSQSLASQAGYQILRSNGNAADAAVAIAAALNVTEPGSTGLGGDCFALYYDAETKQVHAINGSGRCAHRLTLDHLKTEGISKEKGHTSLPSDSVHCITVPGAAAGWVDTISKFGSKNLSLDEIFEPAIQLAEGGFPVHPITAHVWKKNEDVLKRWPKSYNDSMLFSGMAPRVGQVIKNPELAETLRGPMKKATNIDFALVLETNLGPCQNYRISCKCTSRAREIGRNGKSGFYEGRIARSIVEIVQENGGLITLEDLSSHKTTFEDPVSTVYRGIQVWEIPPNSQGIVALMALNILEDYNISGMKHNSSEYLHLLIESIQLAFADGLRFIADPSVTQVPTDQLISKEYAKKRKNHIHKDRASKNYHHGNVNMGDDTVYFSVVDGDGNACSFINSIYMNFGSGLVPKGCGFILQVI
eukprot:gene9141-10114_t